MCLPFFSCLPLYKSSQVCFKALLAAGLAFALVGCGGGSSTTTMTPQGSPAEPTLAETQQMGISAAVTASQTAIDAVDNDATDEKVAAANTALAALKAAIDGATALTDAQKAARTATLYCPRSTY